MVLEVVVKIGVAPDEGEAKLFSSATGVDYSSRLLLRVVACVVDTVLGIDGVDKAWEVVVTLGAVGVERRDGVAVVDVREEVAGLPPAAT